MGRFIGNERALAALQRALASGSPPHAWLFVGPERVGKATLARWLAQALNCDKGEPAPCGECTQCRRIAVGIHSDVQTVTVEPTSEGSQRTAIGVDQIREIERAVALNPFEGRMRVVLIDPADQMTDSAQNAFLKTLEEPPPHTVFVLIASRDERLLETVRSRCRRVQLSLVPVADIEAALVSECSSGSSDPDISSDHARLLARLSGGRIGWALEMAHDPEQLAKRREGLEQARSLGAMSLAERFDLVERLVGVWREDRDAVFDRLEAWRGWYRDVLLVKSSAEDGVGNVDMITELREEASTWSREALVTVVEALGRCREQLQTNVQARIALDALMISIPRAEERTRA